jgi:hypothetical protein
LLFFLSPVVLSSAVFTRHEKTAGCQRKLFEKIITSLAIACNITFGYKPLILLAGLVPFPAANEVTPRYLLEEIGQPGSPDLAESVLKQKGLRKP